MRALAIFIILCVIMGSSMLIGRYADTMRTARVRQAAPEVQAPHIGRIQVLNGCGITGAATAVAGFLREHGFDVKSMGEAETWNYPYTIVVAKTKDMSVARQVSQALKTNKLILLRDNDDMYDVTVVIGPDFSERIE